MDVSLYKPVKISRKHSYKQVLISQVFEVEETVILWPKNLKSHYAVKALEILVTNRLIFPVFLYA